MHDQKNAAGRQLQCIYCRQFITLNADSQETRAAGTDPRQQLRKHLEDGHAIDAMQHMLTVAWLVDLLFFIEPADPDHWRQTIEQTAHTVHQMVQSRPRASIQ